MSYKSLLLYADGAARHTAVFDLGFRLADMFDAHVTGLNVYLPSYQAYAYYGEYPAWDGGAMEREDEEAQAVADRLRDEFQQRASRFGAGTGEWRFMKGDIAQGIALNARYADLVVMAQKDPDDEMSRGSADLPAQVAMASARPVLVVPRIPGHDALGGHAVLAWNATREATRAATSALALLKRAQRVSIAVIDEGRRVDSAHGDEPGADAALYLARHGVEAEVVQIPQGGADVSDVLLATVADHGADWLCMGAYGHSRWREVVLGGTTYDVLRRMEIPTLLAC